MKSFIATTGLFIGLTLYSSATALACACCADAGERTENTSEIGEYERETLNAMKFSGKSNIFLTAGGWEEIFGIKNADEAWEYRLKVAQDSKHWNFSFDDGKGHTGTLRVAIPSQLKRFVVDTTPGAPRADDAGSKKVYKELILKTSLTGTGMFAFRNNDIAKARLIFHGTGNRCDFAGQFTNWSLDVSDTTAKFRFFGQLANKN